MSTGLASVSRALVWNDTDDRVRTVWRIAVPWLTGLLTFVLSLVAAVTAGALMGHAMLIAWITTALVVFGVVRRSAHSLDRRPLSAYGLHFSRDWWLDLGAGFALGSAIVGLTVVVAIRIGSVSLPDGALVVASPSPLWLAAFFVGFVAVAFWEELVFRGVIVTNVIEAVSGRDVDRSTAAAAVALVGSATIYALGHVPGAASEGHSPWLTALWTVTAGLVFGIAYLLTGELALPMGLHLGINYVSSNVFGIAGVASIEGVPTVFVVEHTATGLAAPMSGFPIVVSLVVGGVLVAVWCYWRRDAGSEPLHRSLQQHGHRNAET